MADVNCPKIQELIDSIKPLRRKFEGKLLELTGNRQEDKAKVEELWMIKGMIETKIAELRYEADPYRGWKKFKNGERILHYERYREINDWFPHPEGIVIQFYDYGPYYINGLVEIDRYKLNLLLNPHGESESPLQQLRSCQGNKIFFKGKLVYEGDCDKRMAYPGGAIIEKGPDFFFYDHWPVEEEK